MMRRSEFALSTNSKRKTDFTSINTLRGRESSRGPSVFKDYNSQLDDYSRNLPALKSNMSTITYNNRSFQVPHVKAQAFIVKLQKSRKPTDRRLKYYS